MLSWNVSMTTHSVLFIEDDFVCAYRLDPQRLRGYLAD
jgi:hypothetical protein